MLPLSAVGALGVLATVGWIAGCGAGPEAERDTTNPLAGTGPSPAFASPPGESSEEPPADAASLPALVVEEDAPLLLEEPGDGGDNRVGGSINQPCFVCHVNYREEPLALWHAAGDIGCAGCHGDSAAHRNDENNTTPPDLLYPPEAIGKACRKCHPTHDVAPEEVVNAWRERPVEKRDAAPIVCTDCHGRHRLKARTVRWDKRTGELITGDAERR